MSYLRYKNDGGQDSGTIYGQSNSDSKINMPVKSGQFVSQSDMNALMVLANEKLLPLVNANIAANPDGWGAGSWYYSSGVLESFYGLNQYDIPASKADGAQPIMNPQPPYYFSGSNKNCLWSKSNLQ